MRIRRRSLTAGLTNEKISSFRKTSFPKRRTTRSRTKSSPDRARVRNSFLMKVVLVSTYELCHQPFGLASPQAWLAREGHRVACVDLAVESLPEPVIREADLVAFYLPMHTATRLALPVIE